MMAEPVRVVVLEEGRERTGLVRPGESWAGTARRLAHDEGPAPVALDLSGPVKRFVVDRDCQVSLRAMCRGDLPDVARWRRSAHLHRWWAADGDPTPERVAAQYLPDIDLQTPTRMWMVEVNGRSVGFLQDYRIGDYPDYAVLGPDPDAIGVDYALSELWSGRGLGVRMLWTWAEHARRRHPQAGALFAAPDHRNTRSLRALAKAGFTSGLWFDEPQDDGSVATVVGCTLDVRRVLA